MLRCFMSSLPGKGSKVNDSAGNITLSLGQNVTRELRLGGPGLRNIYIFQRLALLTSSGIDPTYRTSCVLDQSHSTMTIVI
jgi:hypothetical protein